MTDPTIRESLLTSLRDDIKKIRIRLDARWPDCVMKNEILKQADTIEHRKHASKAATYLNWSRCRHVAHLCGRTSSDCLTAVFYVELERTKGLCKVKKNSKNPKIIWIELNPPTHPLSNFFFFETHQWHGQNTQITTVNNVQTEYITLRSYQMSTHSPHWK